MAHAFPADNCFTRDSAPPSFNVGTLPNCIAWFWEKPSAFLSLKCSEKPPPKCPLWDTLFWARLDQWKHDDLRMLCFSVRFGRKWTIFGPISVAKRRISSILLLEKLPSLPRPPLQCWLLPRYTIGKLPRNVHIRHSDGRFREGLVAMVSTLKGGGGGDGPFPNKESH